MSSLTPLKSAIERLWVVTDERPISMISMEPRGNLDHNGLCAGCSELVVVCREAASRPRESDDSMRHMRHLLERSCFLCSLLFSAFQQAQPKHSNVQPIGYLEVLVFSLLDQLPALIGVNSTPELRALRNARDTVCIAVTGLGTEVFYQSDILKEESLRASASFISICLDDDDDATLVRDELVAVQDASSKFDPTTVTQWINQCEQEHSTSCSSTSGPFSESITLIDCKESQVCRLGHNPSECNSCPGKRLCTMQVSSDSFEQGGYEYTALSYVRGNSTPANLEPDTDANPTPPSSITLGPRLNNIPDAITDAMQVTMSLDRRYIWVDQYCIDQNDIDHSHSQMSQMRHIYEKADLTLVAATGEDATRGLSGVQQQRKNLSWTHSISGMTLRLVPRLPRASILSSKWNSRAWTYQEAMLSRRRLVFLEDQVYFECNAAHCCERISIPSTVGDAREPVGQFLPLLRATKASERRQFQLDGPRYQEFSSDSQNLPGFDDFTEYLEAVAEFTKRSLTNQADSLNAFLGIIQKYQASEFPVHHVWGIPFVRSPVITETDLTRLFLTGLSWDHPANSSDAASANFDDPTEENLIHTTIATRRSAFPSWSWAGWDGAAEYPLLVAGRALLERVAAEVSFQNSNNPSNAQTLGLNDITQFNLTNAWQTDYPRTLVLTAPVIPVEELLREESCLNFVSYLVCAGSTPSRTALKKSKGVECVWLGSLRSSGFGLVLSSNTSSQGGVTYQRVGSFHISIDSGFFERNRFDDWTVKAFAIE